MNIINSGPKLATFSEKIQQTTSLDSRVLRLILKVQDLFLSYVVTPLVNMFYGAINEKDRSAISLRKPLNSKILVDYCMDLERRGPFRVLREFLAPNEGVPNLKIPNRQDTVFIPIVLKGFLENHIVLLTINCSKKEIFFYDSKGWTLEDHAKSKTTGDVLLKDVFKKLLEDNNISISGESRLNRMETISYNFQQNTEKVQSDSHNCGIYVIDFMQKTSRGEDPFKNPLSFSEANTEARKKLMDIFSGIAPEQAHSNFDLDDFAFDEIS